MLLLTVPRRALATRYSFAADRWLQGIACHALLWTQRETTIIARMPRIRGGLLLLALVVAGGVGGVRSAAANVASVLLLRVVDSLSRAPVANAEVTAEGRRGLTEAKGEVRIQWPASGSVSVRVRQLGFRYVQRTLTRDPASTSAEDTVVVAMARAAFALPQVATVDRARCREERDAGRRARSEAAMELLRFGAEQYGTFRRRYPFRLTLERRTQSGEPGRFGARVEKSTEETTSAEWGDRYFPGRVIQRTGASSWFVPLLFVTALADSAFWDRHCFTARGVESHEGHRVIRLDFVPALGIGDAEWEGAAWIDSAANVLRRVEFRLTKLNGSDGPRRFEGYTVFTTPSPYIARPDSTVAWWSTYSSGPSGPYGGPRSSSATQALTIRDVVYEREEPPEER